VVSLQSLLRTFFHFFFITCFQIDIIKTFQIKGIILLLTYTIIYITTCTFREALLLNNSKKEILEIIKAYGQKTRKFIIAPKMTLHRYEGHLMICSFGISLIKRGWIRRICFESQSHGFKFLWCSKLVVFLCKAKFQLD
jgi:hypothetical protein